MSRKEKLEQIDWTNAEVLHFVLNNNPNSIVSCDKNGYCSYGNETFFQTFGYSEETLIGKITPLDFYDDEKVDTIIKKLAQAKGVDNPTLEQKIELLADAPPKMVHRLKKADGTFLTCRVHISKVKHPESGILSGYVANIENIEAEIDLSTRFELAAAGASVGIWDWDIANSSLYWSETMREIMKFPMDSTPDPELYANQVHPEDREKVQQLWENAALNKVTFDHKYRFERFDGQQIWVHVRGKAHYNEKGDPIRFSGSLEDITEDELHKKELEDAKLKANNALKIRSQFLANMSHEIRTPMNGVIGMTDLLLETKLDNSQKDILNTIKECGESLILLVNDILDFSKMEADRLELEYTDFPLTETIDTVLSVFKKEVERKRLTLAYEISQDVPHFIRCDKGRFKQVLINLVGNAVKFTKAGRIDLFVEANSIPGVANEVELKFKVKDTGIGMSAQQIKRLFTPFVQADSSTTRKYGGTGLGLAICKKILGLLDGDIEATSKEGEGSQFSFYFKTLKAHSSIKKSPTNKRGQTMLAEKIPLKILLIEDNHVNQQIAVSMLKKLGYEIDVAENGLIGVEMVKESNYDLIFMDLQMPVMDGYEATKLILHELELDQVPTIFAMTANVFPEDKRKCFDLGMKDFIGKPIRKSDITTSIESHFTGEKSATGAAATVAPTTELKLIDHSAITEQFEGMEDVLENIVNEFEHLHTQYFEKIEEAIKENDPYKLERAAHSLKSAVSNFFAPTITDKLYQLESLGRTNSVEGAQEILNSVKNEVKLMIGELKLVCGFFNAAS